MGLFKEIKDAHFLTKCMAQIKHVNPDSSDLAEEFCTTTKHYLFAMRDKGANHAEAVNLVCLLILDKAADFRNIQDRPFTRARALVIASNYCLCFAERWPNHAYSMEMVKTVSAFSSYIKSHPLDLR